MRTLTPDQARAFYDRLGPRQDAHALYEDRAVDRMLRDLELEGSTAVFEFGCGTGRLARRLLDGRLRIDARYVAADISTTMISLARGRLEPFGERVEVRHTDGSTALPDPDGSFDRFVSTYVLDLMSEPAIESLLSEAWRVLTPGGLLGLVSLTHGRTMPSRAVTALWKMAHAIHPRLVGGCRPVDLRPFARAERWRIESEGFVTVWGLTSQTLVARRAPRKSAE